MKEIFLTLKNDRLLKFPFHISDQIRRLVLGLKPNDLSYEKINVERDCIQEFDRFNQQTSN